MSVVRVVGPPLARLASDGGGQILGVQEYRIDDLAREAGVSVRNVRVYQDRGLLPPPRKSGRTGWYSESHLTRLRLIGRMLDRGYTFATISELLTAAQYGLAVEDVLKGELSPGRWTKFRTKAKLTLSELRRIFGEEPTPELISRGTQLGALVQAGKDFAVTSPRLLMAAEELVAAGIPLDTVLKVAEDVRADIDHVATRFVDLIVDRYLGEGHDLLEMDDAEISQVTKLITSLLPQAAGVLQWMFKESMEAEISRALGRVVSELNSQEDSDS